jgi:acyl-CoA thioester hydrolase
MPDKSFHYSHRVTYSDCTAGNHVYYGRFLDMLEAARGDFFRQLGIPFGQLQDKDTIFPVVECRLRYLAPARYDEILRIEVWITTAQRVRLNFGYRVSRETGAVILEGESFHVCTGLDEKPKRLPEDLLMLLKPHVRAATIAP